MKETGKSRDAIREHVMVVEDRRGLFFGRNDDKETIYPVLVVVKLILLATVLGISAGLSIPLALLTIKRAQVAVM